MKLSPKVKSALGKVLAIALSLPVQIPIVTAAFQLPATTATKIDAIASGIAALAALIQTWIGAPIASLLKKAFVDPTVVKLEPGEVMIPKRVLDERAHSLTPPIYPPFKPTGKVAAKKTAAERATPRKSGPKKSAPAKKSAPKKKGAR